MTGTGTTCQVCEARTDAYLCRPCLGEIERDLGDFRSLLHEASNLATRQTKVYRASNTAPFSDEELAQLDEEYAWRMKAIPARLRSRDGRLALPATQVMVNFDARELLADAYDTIRGQVEDLRDLANSEPDGWDNAVPWLLDNLNTIRQHPGAASIHDEITFMHGRLERAVDRSPERIYAGPCRSLHGETCCTRPLYAKPGAAEIECDGLRSDGLGCGTKYSYEDRQEWMIGAVNQALLPLDMWRSALPGMFPELTWPNRSTWHRWARNGILTREGQTDTGEPLYRGGEIVDKVVTEQPRIVGNASKGGKRCA